MIHDFFPSENYSGGVSPVSGVPSCAVIVITGLSSVSCNKANVLLMVNAISVSVSGVETTSIALASKEEGLLPIMLMRTS